MPEYKVYVENNYLFVEDSSTSYKLVDGLAKDVLVIQKKKADGNDYQFKNMSDSVIIASIPYVNIKDENGDDFANEAAWIQFFTNNTGQI